MGDVVEERIREGFTAGRASDALAETVESYGPEVLGFLVSRLRDTDAANDAFSQTCESLCNTIDSFEWKCSMRTWMYKLARTALSRHYRSPANRSTAHISLSKVSQVAARLRTQTQNYMRTDVKDRFSALREELEPDDQTLLILRVDRGMSWSEVAVVLNEEVLNEKVLADEAHQKREAARLRQRFQAVKTQLRELAVKDGLITE